jgi:hypothetical protein
VITDTEQFAAGVVTGLVILTVALIVLVAAPRRAANRALSAYLALISLSNSYPSIYLPDGWLDLNVVVWVDAVGLAAVGVAYLIFVAHALDVRPARALRRPAAITALLLAGAAMMLLVWWRAPEDIAPTMTPYATGGWGFGQRGIVAALNYVSILPFAFGSVCALLALREAPRGSIAHARAASYAAAFLLLDATFVLGGLYFGALLTGVIPQFPDAFYGAYILADVLQLVALAFLARGMLRYQLFDFDLKVKWTLKRGTLVAIILGVFFVATAIAEQYLQGYGFVIGGVAIGLLLFAIRPVERAIDRLADRAMPRTTGTPEYVTFRKLEVYKAAVESVYEAAASYTPSRASGHDGGAHETGGITQRERLSLDRLRAKLMIAEADAASIEADVIGARVGLAVAAAEGTT